MAFSLFDSKGVHVDNQHFTWRDLVQKPISKLDDDAFTRVRIILINGLENEALRFGHMAARVNLALRLPLAKVRRIEQHQATLVNWLIAADHSPLETTIAYEQTAIEVTAAIAQREPDPYLAQVYRFGLLEDFDHLYRYSALLDRLEGKDANNILQSYTDVMHGRPTSEQHRAPEDDLRRPYAAKHGRPDLQAARADHRGGRIPDPRLLYEHRPAVLRPAGAPAVRRNRVDRRAARHPVRVDPRSGRDLARAVGAARGQRMLYVLQLRRAGIQPPHQDIWERFLDYELGHFHMACDALKQFEKRDPAEIITSDFDEPARIAQPARIRAQGAGQRSRLRTDGTRFVDKAHESAQSQRYRSIMNSDGSPSDTVASGYVWTPGTELNRKKWTTPGVRTH